MKSISILGSTGSIGVQSLDVIKHNPSRFKVIALACNSSIDLLRKQIQEFNPEIVAVYDEENAENLRKQLNINVLSGMKGLIELSKLDSADTVINSLVGSIGVLPTIEAIKFKKNIMLANKETLVTAGEIVMSLAEKNKVAINPIDSEHSAIFQCLQGENKKNIKRIILTCSGGAFRNKTKEDLLHVGKEDALKHPNWNMGNKITIDSATLMNKGFEVIEAKMLFGVNYDQIEVVLHPESIIHSMVEFNDTSIKAQLGFPDMKIPIQYALAHPERIKNNFNEFDITKIGKLNFSRPDLERFPCLEYAYDAGRIGGTMPCVLNAANEIAVKAFLEDKIHFIDIPRIIKSKMEKHKLIKNPDINEIIDLDKKIKEETKKEVL